MYTVFNDIKIECPNCKVPRTWENLGFHIRWANGHGCAITLSCKLCKTDFRIKNLYGKSITVVASYWGDIPF